MSEKKENSRFTLEYPEANLSGSSNNRCEMCNEVDRLASRHIAKLLTKLGSTIPPVVEQEIKRQFRFFSNDIISVIQGEKNESDKDSIGNRL